MVRNEDAFCDAWWHGVSRRFVKTTCCKPSDLGGEYFRLYWFVGPETMPCCLPGFQDALVEGRKWGRGAVLHFHPSHFMGQSFPALPRCYYPDGLLVGPVSAALMDGRG